MKLYATLIILLEVSSTDARGNFLKTATSKFFLPSCLCLLSPAFSYADMLTFPLPAPLKNNYALARSAECYADAEHRIQTNPVKKLRQGNLMSPILSTTKNISRK
jgi:hypothetical protein